MIAMPLAELAEVVGGVVDGDPTTVVDAPAFVDSRSPVAGGLFVAIAGEHVDGHDFAASAVGAGAAAVLATRPVGVPAVLVADPTAALGLLARHVVDTLRPVVFAMTGSQGKTGTKDYLAQVLAASGPTVATLSNNNNELGVPLTVLRADRDTAYLVVEMGARHLGNIADLCAVAPPRIAAVLNIGLAHVGEFGSVEKIAQTKGEIVESLPPDGTAVLNADDPRSVAMTSRTRAGVLTFGLAGDVTWRDVDFDALGRPSFTIGYAGESVPVRLQQSGPHQVANAAAAAAMALAAGLGLEQIAQALSQARSNSPWRMEITECADGLVVVNDSYNASPGAMHAALEALATIARRREGHPPRTVAVLGEMRELGELAESAHRGVGRAAAEFGVGVLVVVGEAARGIAEGVLEVPEWPGELVTVAGRDEAVAWVRENVAAGDVVLVKASRGAALEVVAGALLDQHPGTPTPPQ